MLIFQVNRGASSSHSDTSARGGIVPSEVRKVSQVVDAARSCVVCLSQIEDRDALDRELMHRVAILELTVPPGVADAGGNAAALQGHRAVGCRIFCDRRGRIALARIRGGVKKSACRQ